VGDDMQGYTTARDDLGKAREELAEAGHRVVRGPVEQEVFTSPDPAPRELRVRITDGARSWDGTGASEDEAFEDALMAFGRGEKGAGGSPSSTGMSNAVVMSP
jgi:hypothetical protein